MRVIIVGASKVGADFTKWFCEEDFDVVVVDKDLEKLDEITETYDCNGFVGNASSRAFLKKIDIDTAGMVIAVTKDDEANILCCYMAKQMGAKRAIAAVRGPEYKDDIEYIESLGIDMILNPDEEAAKALEKLVRYAHAIEIVEFEKIGASIASYRVTEESKMIGFDAKKADEIWGDSVNFCCVERDGKVVDIQPDYKVRAGDCIYFSTVSRELPEILKKVGIEEQTGKTVIVGGGKIGYFLLKKLIKMGRNVTLVENDLKRCVELVSEFSSVNIVMGDGTDADFMAQCLQGADACIAVTGSDDKNLVISMFAKSFGVYRIAAEIQNDDYEMVMKKNGIAHAFSKQDMVISGILKEGRNIASGSFGTKKAIKRMHILKQGIIESYEFEVDNDFKLCDIPISDSAFKIKKGIYIAAINRAGKVFVPTGSDCIKVGDTIAVIAANNRISTLLDIC